MIYYIFSENLKAMPNLSVTLQWPTKQMKDLKTSNEYLFTNWCTFCAISIIKIIRINKLVNKI